MRLKKKKKTCLTSDSVEVYRELSKADRGHISSLMDKFEECADCGTRILLKDYKEHMMNCVPRLVGGNGV